MADTPNEGGSEPVKSPRGRKPRAAGTEGATPKPRARRPASKPAEAASAPEKVKRTARAAVDSAQRTAVRTERAAKRAARTVKTKVEQVATPANSKRIAIGAAAAVGVAAGVAAAVIGRKKIAQAASNVVDSVTETVSSLSGSGDATPTPPKPSAD